MDIKITMTDGAIQVDPMPEALRNKLRYWKRELKYDRVKRRRVVGGQYNDLWWPVPIKNGDDITYKYMTMPGFAHKVLEFARSVHANVSVEDKRRKMPDPDYEKSAEGLRDYQKEIVVKMLMSGGGIASCPTGSGKTRMAAGVIRAFDHDEMVMRGTPLLVFACPDKDINRKNYEEFVQLFPGRDVGIVMSGVKKFSDDIQIITLDSLRLLDPDKVGVLIVDEMHTASSDTRTEAIIACRYARKWGVSATPTGRFDGKDLVAEGLFGPIVAERTYEEMVKAGALVPIHVLWVPMKSPEHIDRYKSYKERDTKIRRGVTTNARFNSQVGDILSRIDDSNQTLCMTQYLEHLSNIHAACDKNANVGFVHGETSADNVLTYSTITAISPKLRKEIYGRVRSGEIRKIISTYVYKQGVDFPKLDIVINAACAGSDIITKQLSGRASRTADGKDKSYVVDFWPEWDVDYDEHRGPLLNNAISRKKSYGDLGFEQTWLKTVDELPFLKH